MTKALNLDKLNKIRTHLERLSKEFGGKVVQVGLPKGIYYDDGTPVALVGAIQEFGAPAAHIPARPFFQPAVAAKKGEWAKALGQQIKRVNAGSSSGDEALKSVGMAAVADIQQTIKALDVTPLKPATFARKGQDELLWDTGLLSESLQSAVSKQGSEFEG